MKTLIVIDRDGLARTLLAQCVAGQGWRVIEADNGEAGLELAMKESPSAVVCDTRIAGRNGFEICRAIREQPSLKKTRVILTTASHFLNDRDAAVGSGADDWLVKPILPADLRAVLRLCEEDAPASRPPVPKEADPGRTVIRFWGVRGSIPTPGPGTTKFGGNTSCVEVRFGSRVIVLDAGSGIRRLAPSFCEFHESPLNITLLVTHTHWDHIQGFPFFMPAYAARVNVRILGYGGTVHGLRGALFEQMQSAFFPVGLNQMASHVTFEELEDMRFDLGLVKVTAMFANHPGICVGYRLCTPHGDIVYLPDHESYERQQVEKQKAEHRPSAHALDFALRQDAKVIEFMRGADVVIADSQYDEAEYPSRLGWGHTCADDTVQLAVRAGAKRLFLFHHDPDHDDHKVARMAGRAQSRAAASGSALKVEAAREGAELILPPG